MFRGAIDAFPAYGAQEPYLTLLNPLSPNIRIQILQTDLYIFP